jgi:dCMP deaminase
LFVSKTDLENATIYITLFPCISCFKKILQCKIKRIVYLEDYNLDKNALDIFRFYGVQLQKYEKD